MKYQGSASLDLVTMAYFNKPKNSHPCTKPSHINTTICLNLWSVKANNCKSLNMKAIILQHQISILLRNNYRATTLCWDNTYLVLRQCNNGLGRSQLKVCLQLSKVQTWLSFTLRKSAKNKMNTSRGKIKNMLNWTHKEIKKPMSIRTLYNSTKCKWCNISKKQRNRNK